MGAFLHLQTLRCLTDVFVLHLQVKPQESMERLQRSAPLSKSQRATGASMLEPIWMLFSKTVRR
jgi:shikimate kinase